MHKAEFYLKMLNELLDSVITFNGGEFFVKTKYKDVLYLKSVIYDFADSCNTTTYKKNEGVVKFYFSLLLDCVVDFLRSGEIEMEALRRGNSVRKPMNIKMQREDDSEGREHYYVNTVWNLMEDNDQNYVTIESIWLIINNERHGHKDVPRRCPEDRIEVQEDTKKDDGLYWKILETS